jgi:hypothetical protein
MNHGQQLQVTALVILTSFGWFLMIVSTSRLLRQLTSSCELSVGHPTAFASRCACESMPSERKNSGMRADPLSEMAAWKSPLLRGDNTWKWTDMPPALSPKIVTLSGSPPNAAMFLCTQRRASVWSFSAKLPGAASSPVLRKPSRKQRSYRMLRIH